MLMLTKGTWRGSLIKTGVVLRGRGVDPSPHTLLFSHPQSLLPNASTLGSNASFGRRKIVSRKTAQGKGLSHTAVLIGVRGSAYVKEEAWAALNTFSKHGVNITVQFV